MATSTAKISFIGGGGFLKDIRGELDLYLKQNPTALKWAYRRLHAKAAFIVAWRVAAYWYLLHAQNVWQIALYGGLLALGICAAAFSIQHDGNHGSFSRSKLVNRLAGFELDILGASSWVWVVKHNRVHHMYTNVDNTDEDIGLAPFGRMADSQPWHSWHRYQQLYLWFMYGLMTLRLQILGDYQHFREGHIGPVEVRFPRGRELFGLLAGKLLFIGWALVLPLYTHWSWAGAGMVFAVILALSFVTSLIMAVTFQLAHTVEHAKFLSHADIGEDGKIDEQWARHQVMSTADFCPGWRILTWWLGGLNYQVEHHLFHQLPHTLYPRIAKQIVQPACKRYGLTYNCNKTLAAALRSHYRHLKQMGQPPQAAGL